MRKTVVIVGASRGIGRALAESFAEKDCRVIALARSFADEHKLIDHPNISCHGIDLSSNNLHEELNVIFDIEQPEKIDILINNAGYIVVKPFLELKPQEMDLAYKVNVISVMQTIQAAFPFFSSGSHIVNISSMGGFQGSMKFPGLAAYSTSKAAVVSLTELLAEELKETGIKINCLCLGSVQTEMLEAAFPGYKAPLSANEMAEFISDFADNAHRFMHGKIIPVALTTP